MWKVPGWGPIKPKLLPQKRARERVSWDQATAEWAGVGRRHLPPLSGCSLHISDPNTSLCTLHVLSVTNELSTQAHFLLISQIREAKLRLSGCQIPPGLGHCLPTAALWELPNQTTPEDKWLLLALGLMTRLQAESQRLQILLCTDCCPERWSIGRIQPGSCRLGVFSCIQVCLDPGVSLSTQTFTHLFRFPHFSVCSNCRLLYKYPLPSTSGRISEDG